MRSSSRGDLVNRSDPNGYDPARLMLERLMQGFSLTPRQLVLVPGNHDVSHKAAKAAYRLVHRDPRAPLPPGGTYKAHGDEVLEVRDDALYGERLRAFSDFYRTLKGTDYPLDPSEQATLDEPFPGLLVLGLNSAWEIDHLFPDRASVSPVAVAKALDKLGPPVPEQLRVVVVHHPLYGAEDSRIRDHGFLERLAVAGFRVALHGHVHQHGAGQDVTYFYDRGPSGRHIHAVAAGTAGAPTRELSPGYPFQYNLLRVVMGEGGAPERLVVETRKRERETGAWGPDARWTQGAGKDPLPRYELSLATG